MALTPGTRFGPYEIGEPIGAGGMGEVYRARDTRLEREVAIKVLPETFATDADRLARFEQEAKTLASLNHANIAQIHGLEEADGMTAIVMELVEGPTLADRIEQGPIPADQALNAAMQIAEALKAAHQRGIVHRDLKPANIKIRPDGTVKVLDFGIAKAFDPQNLSSGPQSPVMTTPVTQTGIILGTAAYMSPEQARGLEVDQRTDIWAFGCVLYEMLTGQPAFGGEDVALTLARVLSHDTDLDSIPKAMSPAVRQTIELCLKKDPEKRIADIRDVKLAIEGSFETGSGAAVSVGDSPRSIGRRALPLAAAALAFGAVLAGGAVWLGMQPEPAPVNRFVYQLPRDESFRITDRPVIDISPDGRRFVFNATSGMFLRTMDAIDARPIAGTEPEFGRPFFSPDGQSIAFWSNNPPTLNRIPISGGTPFVIAQTASLPFGASWNADGTILFSTFDGIFSVADTGGAPELLVAPEPGQLLHGAQLLPDGDSLLTSIVRGANMDSGQIVVQSMSTGERTVLLEGGSDARYLPTGHLIYALGDDLFAIAFDADSLTVSGAGRPVVQGVMRALTSRSADYAVSKNGTLVYVAGGTGSGLVLSWVDRDGRMEPVPIEPSQYVYPRISRDGTRVALDDRNDGNDVWIYDFARGTRRRLTLGETGGQYPTWTPNSELIAYSPPGASGIEQKAANNTGSPETLTAGIPDMPNDNYFPQFFTDSGRELVFRTAGASGTSNDIGMIALDGDPEIVWLLQGPYNERNAELSPDGGWMAYQSDESGRFEIYVRPFPNVDDDEVPISNAGGLWPLWSRDGKELFYVEPAGSASKLMSVSVDVAGEAKPRFGDPTAVVDYPNGPGAVGRPYDVSPDGQRFLVITDAGGQEQRQAEIVIVENWFEELERLVPTH